MKLIRSWRQNWEVEVKEVAPATVYEREDIHGGLEVEQEIENSPNSAEQGQEEKMEYMAGNEEGEEEQEDENIGDDYGQEGDEEEGWENKESFYQDKRVVFERWLQLAFAKLVARLAEETLLYEDGEEEWDMKRLVKRRFTLTPVHRCRRQRRKEPVILALDFSGSCYFFSNFFLKIAKVAQKFKDVLIVDASNGFWEENRLIGQEGVLRWEELKGRKIIFFGDFDGGVSLVKLSRMAKVWWFSCEMRYEDLSEHSWCYGYRLKDFKGKYYKCLDEHDLMLLCRKL